jgi:hypothetical protein
MPELRREPLCRQVLARIIRAAVSEVFMLSVLFRAHQARDGGGVGNGDLDLPRGLQLPNSGVRDFLGNRRLVTDAKLGQPPTGPTIRQFLSSASRSRTCCLSVNSIMDISVCHVHSDVARTTTSSTASTKKSALQASQVSALSQPSLGQVSA